MQIISRKPLLAQESFEVLQKRTYSVRQAKDGLVCNCPGFSKYGTCRHVKEIEALLNSSELDKCE